MVPIIVVVISLLWSSMATEISVSTPIDQQKQQIEHLFQVLINNFTEKTVFPAIRSDIFYNEPLGQRPTQQIGNDFNLTGLTPEEVRIVMAFPDFSVYGNKSSANESNATDIDRSDESEGMESRVVYTRRSAPNPGHDSPNRLSFLNPLNWFRRPTPPPTFPPPIINNYFVRHFEARPHPQVIPIAGQSGNDSSEVLIDDPKAAAIASPSTKPMPPSMSVMTKPDLGPPMSHQSTPLQVKMTQGRGRGRIPAAYLANNPPELQNVELSGLTVHYPSYPVVDRAPAPQQPKPEYPSTDNRSPVMEVIF